jgi:predicted transcriptional regulator
MSSTFLVTDCRRLRSRLRSSSTVSLSLDLIEPILTAIDSVAEAAVVGIHDELTGQAVNAFVALKDGTESSEQIKKDLILQVRKSIGPFAAPKAIFVVPDLPKTRSGKIMRRILRKILAGEEDQLGDTSTVSLRLCCDAMKTLTAAALGSVRCWRYHPDGAQREKEVDVRRYVRDKRKAEQTSVLVYSVCKDAASETLHYLRNVFLEAEQTG